MASTRGTLLTDMVPGLGWRPLHFEHPLPHERVCQVCGVVCKETVQLPCFHTLCDVCFEGSVALGCVCPIDREVFGYDGIDKLRLRPEHLLKLRVYCWNSANGCNFVGPVSDLLDHFEKDCVQHRVCCPGCHHDMPRQDLAEHRVNGCGATRTAEAAHQDVTCEGGQLRETLGKVGAEIKQSVSELKDGYYRLQTSLNNVADSVNLMRSELRQDNTEAVSRLLTELQTTQLDLSNRGRRFLDDFERAVVEIKQSVAANSGLRTSGNTVKNEAGPSGTK